MDILGYFNLSYGFQHDGNICAITDKNLDVHIEGEKDSNPRHSNIPTSLYFNLFQKYSPQVIATNNEILIPGNYHYFGINTRGHIERNKVKIFYSSHERAHIMSAYGTSPLEQGQPCYVLCWEGLIGKFYYIDEQVNIHALKEVMSLPGHRYAAAFLTASGDLKIDSGQEPKHNGLYHAASGKLMALTGFANGENSELKSFAKNICDLKINTYEDLNNHLYVQDEKETIYFNRFLMNSKISDIGVESQQFKNFSRYLTDEIFDRFYQFAKENLKPGLPLLISGGCGLNCDWNSRLKNCGLFSSVFIPPFTNDSGQSIGLAIDAQHYFTGLAKINWSVYSGENFIYDCEPIYPEYELNEDHLSSLLLNGAVVAWIQGKYESGPRALCHRSLIASPFDGDMHDKLNKIKNREHYRPIAPVCTEEDASKYFDWGEPSPYMLHFMKVKDSRLKAVTHVDGTARIQTVDSCHKIYPLLKAFEKLSGVPVLCNTSLNFHGKGFINRMSDLNKFVQNNNLSIFVVNDKMYIKST